MRPIPTDARADASSRCTPRRRRAGRRRARQVPRRSKQPRECTQSPTTIGRPRHLRRYHDVVDVGSRWKDDVAAVAGADAADDGPLADARSFATAAPSRSFVRRVRRRRAAGDAWATARFASRASARRAPPRCARPLATGRARAAVGPQFEVAVDVAAAEARASSSASPSPCRRRRRRRAICARVTPAAAPPPRRWRTTTRATRRSRGAASARSSTPPTHGLRDVRGAAAAAGRDGPRKKRSAGGAGAAAQSNQWAAPLGSDDDEDYRLP